MLLELKIPALQVATPRLRRCPRCEGITHGHGRNRHRQVVAYAPSAVGRSLWRRPKLRRRRVDIRLSEVEQRRFKCVRCRKTFRLRERDIAASAESLQTRPEGLACGAQRSDRLKAFGVVLYVLGLSYGKAARVIRALVQMGSSSTVYRDVQRAGAKALELHQRARGKVRVLGIDGTGQKRNSAEATFLTRKRMKGWNEGVVFAVDKEGQLLVRVEVLQEANERGIKRFLKELCREYGVKVVISDEHRSYRAGVKGLDVEHQLCEAHWKSPTLHPPSAEAFGGGRSFGDGARSKVRRGKALAERARKRRWKRQAVDLEELQRLVKSWPEAEEAEVRDLWKKFVKYRAPSPGKRWSFGYEIRLLMQDVLENWNRVGPTNNTTERLIGLLLKIRSGLMRGFQKPENIKRFVYLTGFLWANRRACDLAPLFN